VEADKKADTVHLTGVLRAADELHVLHRTWSY